MANRYRYVVMMTFEHGDQYCVAHCPLILDHPMDFTPAGRAKLYQDLQADADQQGLGQLLDDFEIFDVPSEWSDETWFANLGQMASDASATRQ